MVFGRHTSLPLCWGLAGVLEWIDFPGNAKCVFPDAKTGWWRNVSKWHFKPSVKLLDNQMALIQHMFIAPLLCARRRARYHRHMVNNAADVELTALEKRSVRELCNMF